MSKVMFTQPAEYDLIRIEDYIRDILYNPQSSIKVVDGIIKTAEKLGIFPKEHQLVNDFLLADLGFRMTCHDNYNIFYIYDELLDIVHIIRILYNRADWQSILKK
jgi:toxin ParE1/3/4